MKTNIHINRLPRLCVLAMTLFLTFSASAWAQGRTAKEQTLLNVFGRLNLNVDPHDKLYSWTDGMCFFRPFLTNPNDWEAPPRANGDTIYLYGGTLHEGGWGMHILLAKDGKMTVADDMYSPLKKGDRVECRVIGNETLLIFSDSRTGAAKYVLKKFDGYLHERYIDNFYKYIFAGKFKRKDGSGGTVEFNRAKSLVSGLMPKGDMSYTFVKLFGDTPMSVLHLGQNGVYMATGTIDGVELTPLRTGPDIDLEWEQTEDNSKPRIMLKKTAEGEQDLPSGRFPLASKQVMTLTELEIYAGEFRVPNLQVMRNEIFARHGFKFKTGGDMANYFGKQNWYRPQYDDVTSKLTEIERINIALIQLLEKNERSEWQIK